MNSLSGDNMSGYPQGHYDDGYGHHPQGTDSYYQDEQHGQGYYDQNDYGNGNHGGYYDEG